MDLKSIHDVFTSRILRIPSYQRGYSWSNSETGDNVKADNLKKIKGELIDLWNDIINIPRGKWHYTGLLTLVEVKDCEYPWLPKYKQFAIVDGQQRITSVLILIAVMLEKAEKLDIEFGIREGDTAIRYLHIEKDGLYACIFGYDQDNPSDKFFRQHILGLDGVEDDSRESVYTENLKNAKSFFEKMVSHYLKGADNEGQCLQELFDRVTGDLRFNEYVLPEELDEYVVFETMNNRGKPLSELEKLKNRLMYLSDKFEMKADESENSSASEYFTTAQKQDLIDSINKGWITIYQALGANKESPLSDNNFIKAHWITYFDRYNRSESNAHAIHLFNEYFTLERVYDDKLKADDIRHYVKSLQSCAVIWNKIHHPRFFEAHEDNIKLSILGLHRVGFQASFKPLVLAALRQNNASDYLPMIHALESYAFKVFDVSDRLSHTGNSRLYRRAPRVYYSNISAQDAYNEIENQTKDYYVFLFFKNQMQNIHEARGSKGFYGWSGIHYFLFEYDSSLRAKNLTSTQASKLNWQDFKGKNTIEHIYPQSAALSYDQYCKGEDTPDKKSDYQKIQQKWSAFEDYTPDQRSRLCNSLGNLLAISHSDNASFSNDQFEHKVDQLNKGSSYKARGYRYDSMSAQIVASRYLDWTPETIKERGVSMLKALLTMIDEDQDRLSEEEALVLLGLEFMSTNNVQQLVEEN